MKIFIIVGLDEPIVKTDLEEAKDLLQRRYASYSNQRPLSFEQSYHDHWFAFDWSSTDSDGRAADVPEKIYEVDVPVGKLFEPLGDGFAAHLELRVTTRDKKISFQEVETDEVWRDKDLRNTIIRLFAQKAAHVLTASTTEE